MICTLINKVTRGYYPLEDANRVLSKILEHNEQVTITIKKENSVLNNFPVVVIRIEKAGESLINYLNTQKKINEQIL